MNWTEVTDVNCQNSRIVVYVGRSRESISPGDELTFRGDSHPDLFQNGDRYRFVGRSSEEPTDAYAFEHVESSERVSVYKEDIRYYLLSGSFELHGV